jgi:putative zinc finger/helix-turn-helix YgiT family protein
MSGEIKCLQCGSKMNQSIEPYRYGRGLDVILSSVEVRRCPDCGEDEVVIPHIEQLHEAIARAVARKPSSLRPAEIRFLRTFLGYSSVDFANLMGVKPETVSRWENPRRPQSMGKPAERLLRVLVGSSGPNRDYGLEEFLLPDGEQEPEEGFRFCQATDGWSLAEES